MEAPFDRRQVAARLFFEEAAEAAASIVGMHGASRRVALDGGHDREEPALVTSALVDNPLGDVLRAFEAASRIKVSALAAGTELGLAVRTTRERVSGDRQHGAALGAP